MNEPLVSAAWLAERLGAPDLRVVDATWFLPTENRTGREVFEHTHIPGSVFFDIDGIADSDTSLPHMLPTPEAFAVAAGELGLRRDAEIVVYDAQGIFSAPRVWWMLRVMGFTHVRVLDGGLKAWIAEGGATDSGPSRSVKTAIDSEFHGELVRDFDQVARHLAAGDAQIVDARPAARFQGDAPEPRPGLRSGHMPGARSVPWSTLVTPDGAMRSESQITQTFESAGLDIGAPIVATCGSGVSAAVLALALARIGRDDVAVYDGSWAEWGARQDAPVAIGAP